MEELIAVILQFLFEFALEVISWLPIDFVPDRLRRPQTLIGKCILWFFLGCGLAAISVLVFKRTLITHPFFCIANLMLAPLASAFLSQAVARRRQRQNSGIIPRQHFWQAFWFTFGIVYFRFAFAARQ